MPITFVNRQLIDRSYAASPFLTKADSSCYRSTVKSGEAALVFSILFFIMANAWKTLSMRLMDRRAMISKKPWVEYVFTESSLLYHIKKVGRLNAVLYLVIEMRYGSEVGFCDGDDCVAVLRDGPGGSIAPIHSILGKYGHMAGTIGIALIVPWAHSSYPGVLCSPVWI